MDIIGIFDEAELVHGPSEHFETVRQRMWRYLPLRSDNSDNQCTPLKSRSSECWALNHDSAGNGRAGDQIMSVWKSMPVHDKGVISINHFAWTRIEQI